VGEIPTRGRLTPACYKDPERNVTAFEAEGFCPSGDLGAADGDSRLYFHGRIKEMVKTGGIPWFLTGYRGNPAGSPVGLTGEKLLAR